MNRDRIVTTAVSVIGAVQAALVVFGVLAAPQAAALAAIALAFLAGYRTDNVTAKLAKNGEAEDLAADC